MTDLTPPDQHHQYDCIGCDKHVPLDFVGKFFKSPGGWLMTPDGKEWACSKACLDGAPGAEGEPLPADLAHQCVGCGSSVRGSFGRFVVMPDGWYLTQDGQAWACSRECIRAYRERGDTAIEPAATPAPASSSDVLAETSAAVLRPRRGRPKPIAVTTERWGIVAIGRDGTEVWVEPYEDEDTTPDPDDPTDRTPLFGSEALAKAAILLRTQYEARRLPPRTATGKPEVACAFCGKTKSQVKKLVQGQRACICDDCLDLCDEIREDEGW